jgi:Protein of unknown function (DUF1257)
MSHFTKVQTKITDVDCLKQALEDLQYSCREGEVRVRGWRGQWSQADLVADLGGPYNIGFRKSPQGNYEVVADWWGVEMRTGISQVKFVNDLNQRYAYHKVLSEVRKRGFSVAEDETLEDHSIRLVVRKWS